MTCRYMDICLLHDGELPEPQARVTIAHIETCAQCQDWLLFLVSLDICAPLPSADPLAPVSR